MTNRPKAVTVIGWFWRVCGALGLVFSLPYALWGRDLWGQYWPDSLLGLSTTVLFLWMAFASLFCLLVGNGLLKGRDWARILALVYCVVAVLTVLVVYRGHSMFWISLIGDLAFTVIMWFFLYRPEASAFFKGEVALEGQGPA
jgi:hypothetical protein